MWSYDRAISRSCGAVGLVLNGDYPEADLKRMSLTNLEKLVARLVQCTATAPNRPKWWPSGLSFTHPINLGLDDEREIKLAFKQLIISCSQFFKDREWNDENRDRRKRRAERKRIKSLVQLTPRICEPLEECASPSKGQFMQCLQLGPRHTRPPTLSSPPASSAFKLTACINIPFSSDVGRLMAQREHHRMPEDLKLKRLDRSEWYTNKAAPRLAGETEYEMVSSYKEPSHVHKYKMPKRQQHYKRRSLRNVEFLKRFCIPLSVNLVRLDLEQVQKLRLKTKKELVVKIGNIEKLCCDIRTETKIVRTSPRLRTV